MIHATLRGSKLLGVSVVLLFCGQALAEESPLRLEIRDAETSELIPARVYLTGNDGTPYYFESSSPDGSAVRYEKQNWINKDSVEYHTTVSAHPCVAKVPPGAYVLTVERGKTFRPQKVTLEIGNSAKELVVQLQRWANPAERGWYSGDTHIHRTIDELKNVVLAEDLNVVFPLTSWVTLSDTPPSSGDKSLSGDIPEELVQVDETHVIWPRNTEYEIFQVNRQRHTLGALFVLGHEGTLQQTVPPWRPVVEAARRNDPNVLFDMDKLDWPFAMVLPVLAPDSTYELTNNHLWRTEFAFRNWNTRAPAYIQPPFGAGQGGERQWLDYTLGMYGTLLNCGFRLPPSAGTANGVHPVPAGFGRVYVHLPEGFSYKTWVKGLQKGRSFVTTGPMLYATADSHDPGYEFNLVAAEAVLKKIPIELEILSEQPLSYGEIVINGRPDHLLRPQNQKTETGAYRSQIRHDIEVTHSGWFAVRFFEERPDGRIRFAHTAPWYVTVDGEPVRPRYEEKEYLIERMENEIERSEGIVSAEGMAEYREALDFYRALETVDDSAKVERNARELADENRDRWFKNMVIDHGFNTEDVRMATGLPYAIADSIVREYSTLGDYQEDETPELRILPYPGGRHPRKGFLDGAIAPQRETKVSIFPPWKDGGYVVVDVPEAIFSNLGLTYLAHTHIPTIWSAKGVELSPLEWDEEADGSLAFERTLPNGIRFGSTVFKEDGAVQMKMKLTNGTNEPLTGLRSQVCVMLKGAPGFNVQQTLPTIIEEPLVAIKSQTENRWIITAWTPCNRAWKNPPVPCIHSDPIFPDCPPGETVEVEGRMWFYEGNENESEIDRLQRQFPPKGNS
ncbi:MAG: hypothetical protein KDA80_06715 [Planctomycetaceae bacterium]|nr:hypothetical protein [Planctomycetaceae bacterium]